MFPADRFYALVLRIEILFSFVAAHLDPRVAEPGTHSLISAVHNGSGHRITPHADGGGLGEHQGLQLLQFILPAQHGQHVGRTVFLHENGSGPHVGLHAVRAVQGG